MTKTIHLIAKSLLTLMMLMSAGVHLFKHTEIRETFEGLGFPSYIIIPLAILKIIGVLVIWFSKNKALTEWAYAGFFFNFLLAFSAHIVINDKEFIPALVAMVLLLTSYFTKKSNSIF